MHVVLQNELQRLATLFRNPPCILFTLLMGLGYITRWLLEKYILRQIKTTGQFGGQNAWEKKTALMPIFVQMVMNRKVCQRQK